MSAEYSVEEVHELVEDLMSCCRCIGYATSGNERASHISAAKAAKEKLISAYTHPPAQAARVDAIEQVAIELRRGDINDEECLALANQLAATLQVQVDRYAYEGAREDLLDWKGRAQRAEATLRSLGYVGIDASQAPTAEPVVQGEVVSDMQLDFSVNFMDGWPQDEREEVLRNWGNVKSKALAAQPRAVPDVLRETLESIVAADPRKWEELSEPEGEFERWAKSRARHALAAAPSPGESA